MEGSQARPEDEKPGEDGADASRPLSARESERRRRAAGMIAEHAIASLRPDAPYLVIERLVSQRCIAADLPTPSKTALIARISQVRRFGARGVRTTSRQITIDHVLIEIDMATRETSIATLSIAILEPPGVVVAWQVTAHTPLPCVEARLILAVARASTGQNARVQLPRRTDPDQPLVKLLTYARVAMTRAPQQERGADATRILGTRIAGRRLRQRAPRGERRAGEVDTATLDMLRDEVALHIGARTRLPKRGLPIFGIVGDHYREALIDGLERLAARSEPDDAQKGASEEDCTQP